MSTHVCEGVGTVLERDGSPAVPQGGSQRGTFQERLVSLWPQPTEGEVRRSEEKLLRRQSGGGGDPDWSRVTRPSAEVTRDRSGSPDRSGTPVRTGPRFNGRSANQ
ncbi:unnamed protein product [Merluccius merluccius]